MVRRIQISDRIGARFHELRTRLEARFRIKLGDEDLFEYLVEKGIERMNEWDRRT